MNNYRNNMPHYDSMPHHYNPMGINDQNVPNNNSIRLTNTTPTMPGMPENMFQRPFIPETEMPLEIDGDMPALPRMPDTQMPGLTPPWMPQQGMPQQGMPQMPSMPGMPGMPGIPGMPGMPDQRMTMPGMPGMPQNGMAPSDGNTYPMMPGMPDGIPPVTCEQLRELMRRMNCPINGNQDVNNEPRTIVPPENGTVPPMEEDM